MLFVCAILCIGCIKHKDYPEAILQAQSCMDEHPDIALRLLSTYEDSIDMHSEEIRMYYYLLTIQAQDKLYIKPNSDSLINSIVHFYENCDNIDRQIMAYYYQGSVYRDLNDAPRALKSFQQVLQLGDKYSPSDILARTFNQMGTLFAYQGLYDESLIANKKAAEQFLLQGKKHRISYALRDIARMYGVKNQTDSACLYYQRAYQTAVSANDSNRMYRILGEMGCFLIDSPTTREKGKRILYDLINKGKMYDNVNSKLGSLYRYEGKWDSAYYFLDKIKFSVDIKRRYSAYNDLFLIESQKGNYALAIQYAIEANALRDSIDHIKQTEAISKINSLYQYQLIEKENLQLKDINSSKQLLIHTLVAILVIIVTIAIAFYFYMKQQQEKATLQAEKIKNLKDRQYAQSQEAIINNWAKIDMLKKHIPSDKKNCNLEYQLIEARKETLEITNKQIEAANTEQGLRNMVLQKSKIYIRFHKAGCDSAIKISERDWSELIKAIDSAYPNFSDNLFAFYPKLSLIELRICCLIKISIPTSDIANLIGRTRSAVTQSRIRLYKKIHGKDGKAEDLDRFILDL